VMSGWLGGQAPADEAVPDSTDPEEVGLVAQAREVWERLLPPVESVWCGDTRCARWDTGQKPAAIDVGTISVRLLVAELVGKRPRTLVRRAEVTRLGEGLQPGGPLSEAAKQRTSEVVARYANEARLYGADTILLAATSAAREAADGREFVRSLGRDNGITAVVLPGTTEAELAFAGASLDVQGDPVVLDVGGGSTEIMRRLENGAVRAVSLEIGASRATERWIRSDPPSPREIGNVRQEAQWAFGRVGFRFSARGHGGAKDEETVERCLVGVAGTVTTLACLDAGLQKYDSDALHLRTLSLERVRELVERLSALTLAQRATLPCMQAGRAAVIVGGAVIVLAAMETLGYNQLTVSERDLLDGLVLQGVPDDEPRAGRTVLT
jgi:exopolyphosphatase/guanosine-5'-triphosphate,3'-diphosphate pyrophosphatase